MGATERILKFIDAIGISKRQFYSKAGLSNGALDKVENIGTDKVEKIYYAFPQMNLEWLITGRGKMFTNYTDPAKEAIKSADNENNFLAELEIKRVNLRLTKLEKEVKQLTNLVSKR